jgi:hypothetical protein
MRHATLLSTLLLVAGATAQTPTWNEDVSCIVYTHCTPCHHDGGAGHFSLTSYTDGYFWRNEMRAATQVRYMPPWPPDPAYHPLAHERVLSQEEIDIIAEWVDGGALEGDPLNALPAPVYDNGPAIQQPEISVVMDDYTIPPSTTDLYRCFVLQVDNPQDRFITGIEVVPGNTSMVHHVLVFQDPTGQALQNDLNDIGPGYTSFGGIGVPGAKLIGAWVPGMQPMFTAPGMGIKLLADADIVIQVHYPPTSEVEVDSTRINLRMSSSTTLRELALEPVLRHSAPVLQNGPLVIPAGQVRTFHTKYTVPVGITTTGIAPHAHLVCTSMKSFAVLPGGDTIPFIDIPEWDFSWQGFYSFRNPIFVPAGSEVHGYATYDNTVNNPRNPNSPPQTVSVGEATTDEMMLFYFAYTPGTAADEAIVVDDGSGPEYYMDCQNGIPTGALDGMGRSDFRVWPSPATDVIHVEGMSVTSRIRLIDLGGRTVLEQVAQQDRHRISVSGLSKGLYVVEVLDPVYPSIRRSKILIE